MNSLQVKKVGVDNLPAKSIKAGAFVLCFPVTSIFNKCIAQAKVPGRIKLAQVSPVVKKNDPFKDPFQKKNYIPVSILPTSSKTYERLNFNQPFVKVSDVKQPCLG